MSKLTNLDSEKCKLFMMNIANNNVEERSILKELLNKPTVDSQVLKHVFNYTQNDEGRMETFLKTWKHAYFSTKKLVFDEMVNTFYDTVEGEIFETFINTQKDNYAQARSELSKIIDFHFIMYTESNYLDTSLLEKMLALLIANEFMPMNFFLIFNYVCSKECDLVNIKSKLLNGIYNLQLIGYNPEKDKMFTVLQ